MFAGMRSRAAEAKQDLKCRSIASGFFFMNLDQISSRYFNVFAINRNKNADVGLDSYIQSGSKFSKTGDYFRSNQRVVSKSIFDHQFFSLCILSKISFRI